MHSKRRARLLVVVVVVVVLVLVLVGSLVVSAKATGSLSQYVAVLTVSSRVKNDWFWG